MKEHCKNCGGWKGLHHSRTMQCPLGGVEASTGKPQSWSAFKYEAQETKETIKTKSNTCRHCGKLRESHITKRRGEHIFAMQCPISDEEYEVLKIQSKVNFEPIEREISIEDVTLRDFFAAFALCGMISNPGEFAIAYKSGKFFNDCFEVADEMLKARNRKSKV